MTPFFQRLCTVLISVSASFGATPSVAADWQVTLTAEQSKKFIETKSKRNHTVMAISPDSAWGRTWEYRSLEEAKTNALGFCRENLRKGHRDCMIFSVNGKVVLGPVAKTKVVSKVYKPVSGKKAAAHFGLRAINFQGNRAGAIAQWNAVEANPNAVNSLPVNKALGQQLLGSSIALNSVRGFAIALTPYGARHALKTDGGALFANYSNWTITPDGLFCMTNGHWESTGKALGPNCMIIDSIKSGQVRFSWAGSITQSREGLIIAGDAGRGAAK